MTAPASQTRVALQVLAIVGGVAAGITFAVGRLLHVGATS